MDVSLKFIVSLTRISHDSSYSKENPIRTIDSIKKMNAVPGYCGHCCVAMLGGISLQDVQKVMGKAAGSWSKIKTLDYYGICYSEKMVYPKGKNVSLPNAALFMPMAALKAFPRTLWKTMSKLCYNQKNEGMRWHKTFDELTIMDDYIFAQVMRNKKYPCPLLEHILGMKIVDLAFVEPQKTEKRATNQNAFALTFFAEGREKGREETDGCL